jgi:predicted amidohydrolase YtcJ
MRIFGRRQLPAIAILFSAAASAGTQSEALVFTNGAVYTADPARSWATAVTVSAGRVAYVGDDATAKRSIGRSARIIDLHGRMLLPSFRDSHVHPSDSANPATSLELNGIVQRESLLERIRQFAQAHPEKAWITGRGWDEAAFLPSGQPTREMLDAAVPDRPAYLLNNSGHQAWANSRALAAAHITAETHDPENGRIERDASGHPTGALLEHAKGLVEAVIPPVTADELVANLSAQLRAMVELGITAVEDAAVTPEIAQAYQTLNRTHRLDVRANLCQLFRPAEDDDAQIQRFIAQREALAAGRLHAGCVKIFLDGAYGGHSVALIEPYSDDPAKFGRGKLFVDPQRLNRLVTRLDAAGFQVHMHAIGDGAVRAGLDAYAQALKANGIRDNRHTLAHLGLIDDADVARFRTLRVVANMTPLWSVDDPWETVFAPRMFGQARYGEMYRTRTLLEAGVVLVWGSDWPVTGFSPLDGIETAITHRYPGGRDLSGTVDHAWKPEERVSLQQAIIAYTAAGAFFMHDDDSRGSLTVGKAADLVVLSRNLFDTPALDIHSVKVDMTAHDGEVIFERKTADAR